MDYGKYRFEQAKREKEARKNQRVVEIKEIRLTPNIDVGDLNTKVKNACRFLKDGDKVKVSVRFRGREVTHASLGQDLLHRFAELCAECSSPSSKAARCLCSWRPQKTSKPKSAFSAQIQRGANPYA